MRRIALVVPLALAACTDAPTAPDIRPNLDDAFTFTNRSVEIVARSLFVPCANGGAGEIVYVEGELYILEHVTVTENGATYKLMFQPVDLVGTGLTTGTKYKATGLTQDIETLSSSNGSDHYTYVNNFRFIGAGPDNNFLVHETYHVTVGPNGELTTEIDHVSVECR